ncbi:MAG: hypothetical protein FJ088_13965 [Deltaproteobacteria bacterium]|nr:hypothetical protein [Deltaproteobacteria bacterium]
MNEPLVNSFRSIAHKLGLPQSQANSLVDWYLQTQHEADIQNGKAMVEARESLKKEWGPLFGRKHELARRAASHFIGNDAENVFADLPVEAGKRIVQAFAAIGEKLAEHEIISGEIPGGQSLEEIRRKIATIQKDKSGPAFDSSKPGHAEAKKELQSLIDLFTRLGGKWGEK